MALASFFAHLLQSKGCDVAIFVHDNAGGISTHIHASNQAAIHERQKHLVGSKTGSHHRQNHSSSRWEGSLDPAAVATGDAAPRSSMPPILQAPAASAPAAMTDAKPNASSSSCNKKLPRVPSASRPVVFPTPPKQEESKPVLTSAAGSASASNRAAEQVAPQDSIFAKYSSTKPTPSQSTSNNSKCLPRRHHHAILPYPVRQPSLSSVASFSSDDNKSNNGDDEEEGRVMDDRNDQTKCRTPFRLLQINGGHNGGHSGDHNNSGKAASRTGGSRAEDLDYTEPPTCPKRLPSMDSEALYLDTKGIQAASFSPHRSPTKKMNTATAALSIQVRATASMSMMTTKASAPAPRSQPTPLQASFSTGGFVSPIRHTRKLTDLVLSPLRPPLKPSSTVSPIVLQARRRLSHIMTEFPLCGKAPCCPRRLPSPAPICPKMHHTAHSMKSTSAAPTRFPDLYHASKAQA